MQQDTSKPNNYRLYPIDIFLATKSLHLLVIKYQWCNGNVSNI